MTGPFDKNMAKNKTIAEINKETKDTKKEAKDNAKMNKDLIAEVIKNNTENTE